ncbi:V4R domain-containing protein [Methanocaldococcus indicus]|uniref:V4R domain-containing protein n=1 Tax=Methanocaldococcus indicus TaxID=213231 RepID=UPI003C6CF1C9
MSLLYKEIQKYESILNEIKKFPGILNIDVIDKDTGEPVLSHNYNSERLHIIPLLNSLVSDMLNKELCSTDEIVIKNKDKKYLIKPLNNTIIIIEYLLEFESEVFNIIKKFEGIINKIDKLTYKNLSVIPLKSILDNSKKKKVSVALFRLFRFVDFDKYFNISNEKIMFYFGKEIISSLNLRKFEDFVEFFKEYDIGKIDITNKNPITVDVYDCISCSGIGNINRTLCYFEAGLISGFFEEQKNIKFDITEVKCCGLGDNFCRFLLTSKKI